MWPTKKLWIRIEQALTLHQIFKVAMNEFSGKILDLRKLEVISWVGRQIDTNDSLVQRRQIETDVVGKSKLMLSEASGPENTIRSFLIIARPDP